MALVFIDGCAHYDYPLHKYEAVSAGVEMSTAFARRTGVPHITPVDIADYVRKTISGSNYVTVGCAFRVLSAWDGSPITPAWGGITLRTSSSSTEQLTLVWDTDGKLYVKRGGPSGTTLAVTSTNVIQAGRWYYLEFGARISDTLGATEVHLNGAPLSDLTLSEVDTRVATGTIDQIQFSGGAAYCDIWIEDEDGAFHGDTVVDTIMPSGAGATTEFTASAGSNYECVDDDGEIDEDNTYVSSSTDEDVDTYAFANLPSRPSSTILGVAINVAARKDDAEQRGAGGIARISGTDYPPVESADAQSADSVYKVLQFIHENNPADDEAWEEADVNGAEFGMRHIASIV